MDECKVCANADNEYCFACENGNQFKPVTNADRIRAMSDEELAVWMNGIIKERNIEVSCDGWLSWLKSPVEAQE